MTSSLEVVATGAAADAVARHVTELVEGSFASRLFAGDATLWGPDAEDEASKRLGWVGLHRSSRPLVGEIAALRDELAGQGLDRVVLCGMGGSSLAPEVICATADVPLVVLDSSNPDQVRDAVGTDLERTVVVVSSKSGSTVETDSQRRAFEAAFREAGIDAAGRIVVVTDPGSPLDDASRAAGFRVVNADPSVGGRFSALTAFGLVPSGLAGADVEALLDEAESVADLLAADDDGNPGLRLGAALGGTDPLRDKLVFVDDGSGLGGFAAWAEQLIAESTGKLGTGLLPVVVGGTGSPEVTAPPADATVVRLVGDVADASSDPAGDSAVQVAGSLGAQLLLWEVATAVAGRLLGINPFDQPDVESAKKAARALLESPPEGGAAGTADGPVLISTVGDDAWLGDGATTVAKAVDRLLGQVDEERGYLAVMAYLDRTEHARLEEVRESLARWSRRPVTFGWGPRFLHSTGQFHKGGPPVGVYLQVTAEPAEDLDIPGRDFGFATLVAAQAAGDAQVLADRGRPVLRLHLTDQRSGLERLLEALGGPGPAGS
ncbi:glucose-6-phosphate isomerase [Nocardioides caldifontis]|uniref:glucose-6-phosphate isomerase n=1 Tax=Nocardioides caldifontis TaxID=2588938 RepID=UPI0011E02D18|nr:glucose-6-phosphate isomerase [Nocardioides caldifontis]